MKMAKASTADMEMAMRLCSALEAIDRRSFPEGAEGENDKADFDCDDDAHCGQVIIGSPSPMPALPTRLLVFAFWRGTSWIENKKSALTRRLTHRCGALRGFIAQRPTRPTGWPAPPTERAG